MPAFIFAMFFLDLVPDKAAPAAAWFMVALLIFIFAGSIVTACISMKCLFEEKNWVAMMSLMAALLAFLFSSCVGSLLYFGVLALLKYKLRGPSY
jgi:hypothetical protein